jgi:hypothetical protein
MRAHFKNALFIVLLNPILDKPVGGEKMDSVALLPYLKRQDPGIILRGGKILFKKGYAPLPNFHESLPPQQIAVASEPGGIRAEPRRRSCGDLRLLCNGTPGDR